MLSSTVTFYGVEVYIIDVVAALVYCTAWFTYTSYAQRQSERGASLMSITAGLRQNWMHQMLHREMRIVDASLISNLLRSITFFANTSIFVLFGLITMLGYRDQVIEVVSTIPFAMQTTDFTWEFKIFLMAFMFIYAFFKYTWSLRLYNYASIYVGAAPDFGEYEERWQEAEKFAQHGGRLIAIAGQHFNMGLRAYYFGLTILSWFIHPILFIAAIAWVVYEVHRREFRSHAAKELTAILELTSQNKWMIRGRNESDS